MKTRAIAICNMKGGVAKTTTTFSLAKYLAKNGKNVLCVDLDPQGNLTELTGLNKNDENFKNKTIAEIFKNIDNSNFDFKNLILKVDDISLVIANRNLQYESESVMNKGMVDFTLEEHIEKLINENIYDYILFDTPPSTSTLTSNGIIASNEIIIPIQAEMLSLNGTADMLDYLDELNNLMQKARREPKKINGALITMVDLRTSLNRNIEQTGRAELEKSGINVFKTIIHRNSKIGDSQTVNKSVFDYDNKSKGAIDYANFALEIINQEKEI